MRCSVIYLEPEQNETVSPKMVTDVLGCTFNIVRPFAFFFFFYILAHKGVWVQKWQSTASIENSTTTFTFRMSLLHNLLAMFSSDTVKYTHVDHPSLQVPHLCRRQPALLCDIEMGAGLYSRAFVRQFPTMLPPPPRPPPPFFQHVSMRFPFSFWAGIIVL